MKDTRIITITFLQIIGAIIIGLIIGLIIIGHTTGATSWSATICTAAAIGLLLVIMQHLFSRSHRKMRKQATRIRELQDQLQDQKAKYDKLVGICNKIVEIKNKIYDEQDAIKQQK